MAKVRKIHFKIPLSRYWKHNNHRVKFYERRSTNRWILFKGTRKPRISCVRNRGTRAREYSFRFHTGYTRAGESTSVSPTPKYTGCFLPFPSKRVRNNCQRNFTTNTLLWKYLNVSKGFDNDKFVIIVNVTLLLPV